MANIFTVKTLADGQLPSSKNTLYTVLPSTSTIVKTITYVNSTASTIAVNLYVNIGGTSRRIIPTNMSMAAGALMIFDDELTLAAGNTIEGDASAATSIDYVIEGVEET